MAEKNETDEKRREEAAALASKHQRQAYANQGREMPSGIEPADWVVKAVEDGLQQRDTALDYFQATRVEVDRLRKDAAQTDEADDDRVSAAVALANEYRKVAERDSKIRELAAQVAHLNSLHAKARRRIDKLVQRCNTATSERDAARAEQGRLADHAAAALVQRQTAMQDRMRALGAAEAQNEQIAQLKADRDQQAQLAADLAASVAALKPPTGSQEDRADDRAAELRRIYLASRAGGVAIACLPWSASSQDEHAGWRGLAKHVDRLVDTVKAELGRRGDYIEELRSDLRAHDKAERRRTEQRDAAEHTVAGQAARIHDLERKLADLLLREEGARLGRVVSGARIIGVDAIDERDEKIRQLEAALTRPTVGAEAERAAIGAVQAKLEARQADCQRLAGTINGLRAKLRQLSLSVTNAAESLTDIVEKVGES